MGKKMRWSQPPVREGREPGSLGRQTSKQTCSPELLLTGDHNAVIMFTTIEREMYEERFFKMIRMMVLVMMVTQPWRWGMRQTHRLATRLQERNRHFSCDITSVPQAH